MVDKVRSPKTTTLDSFNNTSSALQHVHVAKANAPTLGLLTPPQHKASFYPGGVSGSNAANDRPSMSAMALRLSS